MDPDSATSLADLMCKIIKGEHIDYSKFINKPEPGAKEVKSSEDEV